jgi:hypothetical protein
VRIYRKAFFRALIVLSAFATLLLLGLDPKAGVIAILAITVVDALSFLLPLGVKIRNASDRESAGSDLR